MIESAMRIIIAIVSSLPDRDGVTRVYSGVLHVNVNVMQVYSILKKPNVTYAAKFSLYHQAFGALQTLDNLTDPLALERVDPCRQSRG